MKTIEITVDPEGRVTVETKGFVGGECRGASRPFEMALGVRTAERLTAEFHQPHRADQPLRQLN